MTVASNIPERGSPLAHDLDAGAALLGVGDGAFGRCGVDQFRQDGVALAALKQRVALICYLTVQCQASKLVHQKAVLVKNFNEREEMNQPSIVDVINSMCSKALMNVAPNWMQNSPPAELTPIQAMFVLAVDGMRSSPLASLGEESVTAALVGRLAAQFMWTVTCLGNNSSVPALWGQYSKNGQDADGESRRGADFALVIPMSADLVRIAIFQAKRGIDDFADVSQPGSKTAQAWQYSKLADTAAIVELTAWEESGASLKEEERGTWVHYVFWQEINKAPKAISVSAIDQHLNGDMDKINLMHSDFGSFVELLLAGTNEVIAQVNGVVEGWLQLDMQTAITCLPNLLNITDVVFADEKGEGRGLANELSKDPTKFSPKIIKSMRAAATATTAKTTVRTVSKSSKPS